MKTCTYLKLALIFTGIVACAYGQLVYYDFNAGLNATGVGAHVDSASVFAVSDGTFTSTNFTTGSPPDSPAVADSGSWNAGTPTKFFSFTITPEAGYELEITGISFDYRQTSSGALNYQIDVGGEANVASGVFVRDSTWRIVSTGIVLSALVSSPVTISIFGYGGGTGSFAIDRVALMGTATAIPEPSACAALMGLAVAGAIIHRRRKKRSSSE